VQSAAIWQGIPKNWLKGRVNLQKNPTMTRVVAAALVAADGRVLMQRRPANKHHGGLWEFPGGKIEAGELPAAALARELEEELGIAVEQAAFDLVAEASDPTLGISIELMICRQWSGEPQCLEGEAIGWFTLEGLDDLPMPPLDRPLAQALNYAI
jgi:8-oxo-dGTP diphosphatase